MRARGGTRTAFPGLQTLGTRENMRNPTRSDRSTTESEAQSVDIVHTRFRRRRGLPVHQMPGNLGRRVLQVDSAPGDSNDEVEAFIRGEAMTVTVDPQQQHHERPRSPFVPINEWMEPGDRLQQSSRLHCGLQISVRAHDSRSRPGQCRGQQADITNIEGVPIYYLKGILNVQDTVTRPQGASADQRHDS